MKTFKKQKWKEKGNMYMKEQKRVMLVVIFKCCEGEIII